MQTKHKIFGRWYITDDALTCGDYGGAGSVGVANIRSIMETPGVTEHAYECGFYDVGDEFYKELRQWETLNDAMVVSEHFVSKTPAIVMHARGDFGSESIYILDNDTADETILEPRAVELLDSLREIIDSLADYPCIDDETVSAVESEWENEAFECYAKDDLINTMDDDVQERAGMLDYDILFECYRHAMEDENEYPEPEDSGTHIPVDRIAASFAKHVLARL